VLRGIYLILPLIFHQRSSILYNNFIDLNLTIFDGIPNDTSNVENLKHN
jgi:hypothetical protein